MQFNPTSGSQGIVQDIDFFSKTNTSSYPIADKTRNVNRWLDDFSVIAMQHDNTWDFDDTNYTTYPIATRDLVAGQQDYQLTTSQVRVLRAEVKDSNGDFYEIFPIDQSQIRVTGLTEWHEDDGLPRYYDIIANSLFLYPAPASADVTLSAGLKVYFQREMDYFTATDTSKEPGIPSQFHRYPVIGASLDYAEANAKGNADELRARLADMREQMKDFYRGRLPAKRNKLTVRRIPNR